MFHLTVRNRPLDSGWARVADLYADHLRWLCPDEQDRSGHSVAWATARIVSWAETPGC